VYDDIRGGAQSITAGLGYLNENFGVEVSLRQGFEVDTQTTMLLAVRYFYQAPQQQ
jgi:hypothetical protein